MRSLGWNPLPEEDRSMFLAVLRGEAMAGGGVSEHCPTDEVTQPSPAEAISAVKRKLSARAG